MTDRAQLHARLREGGVQEADSAMGRLLDVGDADQLDPADVAASLDAMDRLGPDGQAYMFESFMQFAERFPQVTGPALVERLARSPERWSAGLAAATLREILAIDGPSPLRQQGALDALIAAVRSGAYAARDAVGALRDWVHFEPIPEAADPIAGWLLEASKDEPVYGLQAGVEALQALGRDDLLASVLDRARMLPEDHPLRRAMG